MLPPKMDVRELQDTEFLFLGGDGVDARILVMKYQNRFL